jgi:hypothetical protein
MKNCKVTTKEMLIYPNTMVEYLHRKTRNYIDIIMLVVELDYLPDSEVLAFNRVYTP